MVFLKAVEIRMCTFFVLGLSRNPLRLQEVRQTGVTIVDMSSNDTGRALGTVDEQPPETSD